MKEFAGSETQLAAMKLSDDTIDAAKAKLNKPQANFEHNDCIRMAYEWLDAQTRIKRANNRSAPLKHLIERWCGRYVSQSDVEVAAMLHPDITGEYPRFNISVRFTEPNARRLDGIGEAFKHRSKHQNHDPASYASQEP